MNLGTLYRLMYPLARAWWYLRRPHIRAATAIVTRHDKVLLIRHTYGRRDLWYLPGGLMNPGEDAGAAAVRETIEETGIILHGTKYVTTVTFKDNYRHVTLEVYRGRAVGGLKLNRHEIAAAEWFKLTQLPPLAEGTRLALKGRLKS